MESKNPNELEPIRVSLVSELYNNDICSICRNELEDNIYTRL